MMPTFRVAQMLRFFGRLIAVPIVTLAATAVLPASSASAGTYEVWTCRAPDGTPAATTASSGGWKSMVNGGATNGGNDTYDTCVQGGVLRGAVAVTQPQPTETNVAWTFSPPSGTKMTAYYILFSGFSRKVIDSDGDRGDLLIRRVETTDTHEDGRWIGGMGPNYDNAVIDPPETWGWAGPGSNGVMLKATCSGPGNSVWICTNGSPNGVASFSIFRGVFKLEDRDSPVVTAVSGDAVTEGAWNGSAGIAVGATDQGGGVYRLGVEVDGKMRSWVPLAGAPCRAWPGTTRTFVSPKPCPSAVGGMQTIDTRALPEGRHTVRVVVEDAAGNQTTAYGPTTKTLRRTVAGDGGPTPLGPASPLPAGPGPLNGSPASVKAHLLAQWAGRESRQRTVRYSQRPTVKGQLTTPTGQPIRDADVRVLIRRDARNSPLLERDSLKTDRRGRFRWKLPKHISSRNIEFSYRWHVRDPAPVAKSRLRLRVKSPVHMKLSRHRVRRGQSVKLTGRLPGRPMPKQGKVVELQARNVGKKWITFRTIRTKKNGKFAARYRFRKPGPARFQMRARVRRAGDYPYATGSSRARNIRVR